jgi:hypothetical protein
MQQIAGVDNRLFGSPPAVREQDNGGGFMSKYLRHLAAAVACAAVAIASAQAQSPVVDKRIYHWYGELVSLDAGSRTLTVRVPVEQPVTTYLDRFKPGEKVVLVFTANAGKPETGPVLYIEKLDVMKSSKVDVGYILPVEYASGDAAGKTVTFRLTLPESSMAGVKGVTAGQWMKATAPMSQPGDMGAVASIESSQKPAPFVRDAPPAQPAAPEQKKRG